MKKLYLLLSVVVVFASLVAACGGTATPAPAAAPAPTEAPAATQAPAATEVPAATEPPKEAVTIRAIIRPDEGENVAIYSKKFTEETGINVDVTFVGWAEIHDKTVTTLAGGGGGYDIVFIPGANAAEFQAGGWFEPVDDLIPANERDQWLQSVVDLYTGPDGHLFAMPWYSGGAHMAYNTEIIEKAGVDVSAIKTWDDLAAACKVVQEKKAAEFCFSPSAKYPGNMYFNWGTMVLGFGGEFFDKDGNPIFQNTDAAVKAWQWLADGVKAGYVDPAGVALDDYETLIEFGSGKTAFLLNSTWSVTQANKPDLSKIPGKVGYMLIPGSGIAPHAQFMYAGGLGLLKTSEHKDEAKQFLKYLTGEQPQKDHAIQGANAPTRVALFKDPDIPKAWTGFDVIAEQLNYGEFPPQVPWLEEFRHSAASATQDVIAGRKTPEEAQAWLLDEVKRIKGG